MIARRTRKIERELKTIPPKAYNYFVKVTPIDTGRARRSTKLKGQDTIHANYPYAKRLDQGWSKQAKDGMIQPTFKYIRQLIRKIVRGK